MSDINYLKEFVEAVDAAKLEVKAVSFYYDNKKVEEYFWEEDKPRNIWSHTKAFTSAAAGIAVAEGKLKLESTIADVFPEIAVRYPGDARNDLTLKNLLMMTSGFFPLLLMGPMRDSLDLQYEKLPRDTKGNPIDLIDYLMQGNVVSQPGTVFGYNNGDAYVVGRMIERATGMSLQSYVYYKILKPMGIACPAWGRDLAGHCFGDAQAELRLNDMACLGRLYMDKGIYEGRQLVPYEWIQAATSKQIDTPPDPKRKVQDPWGCGYGYLVWMYPMEHAYRFSGAKGQHTLMFPDQGIEICVQSDTARMNEVKQFLDEYLVEPLVKNKFR